MLKRLSVVGVLALVSLSVGAAQGAPPGAQSYVVVLKDGADAAAVSMKHKERYGAELSHVYKHALKGYAAQLNRSAVEAVKADPSVLFVSDDWAFAIDAPPVPPADPQVTQRSVDRIDAEESSTRSGNGRGAVPLNVAVLDTGIDVDHPELVVKGGANCVNDKGGIDDPNSHGTLVAGSIGAIDNTIGFVGVAPGAHLWSVRVFDKHGNGGMARMLCGIDWVTSTRTDSDPTNDIRVANLSGGTFAGQNAAHGNADDGNCGLSSGDALHMAICRAVAADVTFVVSAGNDAADVRTYVPAAYDEVLSAAAMTDTDGLPGAVGGPEIRCGLGYPDDAAAEFSNFATLLEDRAHTVSAPGVCVPSTWPGGLYGRASGTSFASPLVAGTVTLCIFAGPCAGLSPAQIVAKIVSDAATYNNDDKNSGYGFQGDPLRPVSGKYYGYLIRAGQY